MAASFSNKNIDINSLYLIHKIAKSIYLIEDIKLDSRNYFNIKNLLSIIDYGFKFIPCQHMNTQSLFYNTIKNFDKELLQFNSKLFFELNNQKKNSNLSFNFKNDIEVCHEFDCIMDKIRVKNNKDNFFNKCRLLPFLSQSLEFRFQFIFELSKTKFSYFQNI